LKTNYFFKSTCAIFSLMLLNMSLSAQSTKGTINGKVTDINGLPLSNASVTIKQSKKGTITDEKGNFLLKLPAGNFTLVASYSGYKPDETQINLSADQFLTISFKLLATQEIMQEVVVSGVKVQSATATRTKVQIQDVPQAITVIGQKVIRQQAVFDLTTITRNITGLNFTGSYSGAGSSQFFNARGFELNDAQNYRWNGVMIWNFGNNYADNIEQVEFLKGPTSILFGDVAPGGVMNFVTKRPLGEFMANVNFKTGSWGLIRPSVDITGPLTKDHKLRYRLNTSFERSDSFRHYVSSARAFIAPTIAWDITPKLSLNVEAVFKRSKATDDAGLVSPDGTINGLKSLSPSLYLGEPSRKYRYSDQSYFSTLTYEFNKSWRIKATGFYGNTTHSPFGIWFDHPEENGNFARREYGFYQRSKNGTVSLDAYGTFYTGAVKHNLLIGAEYQTTRYRNTNGGELSLLDTNNVYNPVYGQSIVDEPVHSPMRPYVSLITRKGVHLQDQVMFFNEKLHLLLGLRAGSTRQGNHYYANEAIGTEYEGNADDIVSKTILTPRVGVVYKPQAAYSLYASYSKGYEINSPDIFAQNYFQYATPPATISTQVEVGAKASLLNNRLGVTLSLFEINKQHPYGYVYLDQLNPNYDEYNVYYDGHHRSRGAELEADGKLLPSLSVTAGVAYTKTKVIYDPKYPTGNLLPNAPKFTANGWLNYEPVKHLRGLTLGTGLFYKGTFFSSIANDPDLQIPSGYTWDAAAGYKYKQFGVQLNIMNITNQVSYLNPWQFNLFDVRPLRQFVVSLNYSISK
jgi:iron complex outermembrane receptor protein